MKSTDLPQASEDPLAEPARATSLQTLRDIVEQAAIWVGKGIGTNTSHPAHSDGVM